VGATVTSAIAVVSVALAVCGLGAAVRASADAEQVHALAAASVSSPGGRGLLPAIPPHPARAATAAAAKVPPAPAPPTTTPPPPASPAAGPMPVAQTSLPLVDTSRQARSGPRVLTTSVWYPPASGGQYPLIVFAHGFNVTPASYAGLLQSWARAGYVVAAPTFPLTNSGTPGGPDETDVVNQPADIRFVIDQLLAADAKQGPLADLIDPHKIGVAGHSDGAITAAAVAYNTCSRDPRISAAVVMAGAELGVPGGSYFPSGSAPLLVAQGTADRSNNPLNSLQLYNDDGAGPKYLVELPGASHEGPFMQSNPGADLVEQATVDFFGRYLKNGTVTQLVHDASVPGLASILAPLGQS
jgi:dienelactone hydrolase